jgi:catalase
MTRATGLSCTAGVVAWLASGCALAPARAADTASVAEQTVDAMNKVWGKHAGFRANHAKGLVVSGTFTPSHAAAALSRAEMFNGKTIAVTARFSDATGVPTLPDGSPNANPHGFAVRFHQPKAGDVDIVDNSLKFFPVATGAEFRDFLLAVGQSGPGAAKPTKLDAFLAGHPAAPKALGSVATPSSLSRETYNGVDAFVLVNAAGKRQAVRFQAVPVDGTLHLSAADAAKRAPDFLMAELPKRLAQGPVRFHLLAQLAGAGDPTNDATRPWPATRKMVDLGTITLTKADPDSATTEKTLLFLPGNLTDGIEPSDDPLIDARNQAYAVSFGRRSQ